MAHQDPIVLDEQCRDHGRAHQSETQNHIISYPPPRPIPREASNRQSYYLHGGGGVDDHRVHDYSDGEQGTDGSQKQKQNSDPNTVQKPNKST